MNWVNVSYRQWVLVANDGEVLETLYGNNLGLYTVQSTGKVYLTLDKAKEAAQKAKEQA